MTDGGELLGFDPPSLSLRLIGKLECPGEFFSMTVDRDAIAWVLSTDGSLFGVDTKTAACAATSFVPGQHGFQTFGMGFSADTAGGDTDTLFVAESGEEPGGSKGLARIDLTSMTLIPIGPYNQPKSGAELTGTGDARLYACSGARPSRSPK